MPPMHIILLFACRISKIPRRLLLSDAISVRIFRSDHLDAPCLYDCRKPSSYLSRRCDSLRLLATIIQIQIQISKSVVATVIRLRFDGRSTAIQLLMKGH